MIRKIRLICLHALADHPEINISIDLCKITINIIQTLPKQNRFTFERLSAHVYMPGEAIFDLGLLKVNLQTDQLHQNIRNLKCTDANH